MAEFFLTNTLTRSKEKFTPIKNGTVGIYSCGPTVYRHVHIGNLRTYISNDILKRMFLANGYKVNHVKNITDVGHMRTNDSEGAHDPVITEALKEGKTPLEIAENYTKLFQEDEKKLNIVPADHNPKATDHVKEMIEIIKVLLDKGFAYETDGVIYFDVKKFADYGKLSGNTLDKMDQLMEAVRVSVETDKKDSVDFALWKKAEEDRLMSWDSPWGKGFPGWHIECSAMSMKYLTNYFESDSSNGERSRTIDIHTGGEDLIFPHHEDEIAQTQSATGEKFVNYWVHSGHLQVDGKKMSRSSGNFYTLEDIIKKGFNPLAFRLLVLMNHYRGKLNFTWESLEAAQTALNNLYREMSTWENQAHEISREHDEKFTSAINDDLDTPTAVAVMWDLVKSPMHMNQKAATLLKFDMVLGLGLKDQVKLEIPEEVNKLVKEREEARKNKDFAASDKLRDEIAKHGYEVIDELTGQKLKKIID